MKSSALPSWQVAHSMKNDQNTLIIHHKVKIPYLQCVYVGIFFFSFSRFPPNPQSYSIYLFVFLCEDLKKRRKKKDIFAWIFSG